MRRTLLVVVAVGLLVATLLSISLPAGASATGGGQFSCTVKLPVWPTPNGPAVNCNGKANGVTEGRDTAGKQYVVAAVNAKSVGAASTYKETCTAGEPLNGTAKGTSYVSGLRSISPAGTANGSAPFNWTRVGSTAVITFGAATIKLPGNRTAKGKNGLAVAVFVPTSSPGNCAAPKPLTALIVGVSESTS